MDWNKKLGVHFVKIKIYLNKIKDWEEFLKTVIHAETYLRRRSQVSNPQASMMEFFGENS